MKEFIDLQKLQKNISLVELLSRLGYEPSRRSGKELIYISMLRMPESTPSLCVNDELGVWYDHGTGLGGTLIDFGKAYWQGLPFKQVLANILQAAGHETGAIMDDISRQRAPSPEKVLNYGVQQVKEIGHNPAIAAYLRQRKVWDAAQGRLKEIYYYVQDPQQNRKQYFAAGWQNEKGGWEVRNPYFKGCLGKKAMSFIDQGSRDLVVFEGYIDYLSWLTEYPGSPKNVLVLNTLSLLAPAIERSGSYDHVDVYFDHDHSGRSATEKLLKAVPQARDYSSAYERYNDYNDKLMADRTATITGSQQDTLSATDRGNELGR